MKIARFLGGWAICLLVLAACTAVPDPTSTPIQSGAVATVVVERPSVTPALPVPAITPYFTDTPQPVVTPTRTAVSSPTPPQIVASTIPLLQLQWTDSFQPIAIIKDWAIKWSPIANEFIYTQCGNATSEQPAIPNHFIYAQAPLFSPVEFPQTENPLYGVCQTPFGFTWTPDGQQVVFIGTEDDFQPIGGVGNVWIMDRTGSNAHLLSAINTWIPYLGNWLNDETLFFQNYSGGGVNLGITLNTNTGEYQEIEYVLGLFMEVSKDYLAITHGTPIMLDDKEIWYNTVAVMSRPDKSAIPVHTTQMQEGHFLHWLSFDYGSAFLDWLPDSNKMLIATWQDIDTEIPKEISLQLWDVDTGDLTMIAPGGWSGVFSPDGRYLTFYTRSEIEVNANNQPVGVVDRLGGIEDEYLHLIDLSTGQIIISIPTIIQQRFANLLWSPGSQMFVYQDRESNFVLFDVDSQSMTLITLSGGERLSNPQWAFDGSYLSVTVEGEDGAETAVLAIP